jgi:hypothetical protein
MEIEIKEKEAMKDVGSGPSILVDHPSYYQEKSIELDEPVDLPGGIVLETMKRPFWLCHTLQDVERHATPRGTFKKSR